MLIAIEGLDGAGKTSVINRIAEHLHQREGIVPLLVNDWAASACRQLRDALPLAQNPVQQLAIVNCARCLTMEQITRPALKAGRVVIYDRYFHTTLAYQGAQGVSLQHIRQQHDALGMPLPDVTLFLWINPEEARRRMVSRGKLDAIDAKGDDFFGRVNDIFLTTLTGEPGAYEIDAGRPLDQVAAEAIQYATANIMARISKQEVAPL